MRELPTLRLGTPLAGRYRLDAELGRGGMGVVYRAWDEEVREEVAVKLLPELRDEADRTRFRREVRLARRVTHPNVARTHDLGVDGDQWFVTMELVHGESLQAVLRREAPLAAERAVAVLGQVADALAAAHDAGVLHRDLKPANILVESGGRAVLTDFGIASAVAGEDETVNASGTPAYMSPEQVRGLELGPRSDLYSLGVVLFEALTGHKPFGGPSAQAVAYARLRRDPPDPRTLAAVPDDLATLVLALLQRDPEQRPASAQVLARALRERSRVEVAVPAAQAALRIRVPPLRWLGGPDGAWLAEAMTGALQHDLARTPGLEVVLAGEEPAASDRADDEWTVTGTVLRAGDRVRVAVHLARAGAVSWTETFDADVSDVLVLQESIAGRIAETLRVALSLRGRAAAPRDVIERYLRIRARTRGSDFWMEALLPELAGLRHPAIHRPVLALEALIRASLYWMSDRMPERDEVALAVVRAALREAPDEPDSHVADALVATANGDLAGAARALGRAIVIAPGTARPYALLGLLECEADRHELGIPRLERAVGLDPDLRSAWMELARQRGLTGDILGALELIHVHVGTELPALMTRARLMLWGGHPGLLEAARDVADRRSVDPHFFRRTTAMEVLIGDAPARDALVYLDDTLTHVRPRYGALICQISTEVLCHLGELALARQSLLRAATLPLVDLRWLDRCPVLEPLRDSAEFERVRRDVRVRVGRVWLS